MSSREDPAPPGGTHTHTYTHTRPSPFCSPSPSPAPPDALPSGYCWSQPPRGLLVGPDFPHISLSSCVSPGASSTFQNKACNFVLTQLTLCVFFSSGASQIEYVTGLTKPRSSPSPACAATKEHGLQVVPVTNILTGIHCPSLAKTLRLGEIQRTRPVLKPVFSLSPSLSPKRQLG